MYIVQGKGTTSIFCILLSRFPNTICGRDALSPLNGHITLVENHLEVKNYILLVCRSFIQLFLSFYFNGWEVSCQSHCFSFSLVAFKILSPLQVHHDKRGVDCFLLLCLRFFWISKSEVRHLSSAPPTKFFLVSTSFPFFLESSSGNVDMYYIFSVWTWCFLNFRLQIIHFCLFVLYSTFSLHSTLSSSSSTFSSAM